MAAVRRLTPTPAPWDTPTIATTPDHDPHLPAGAPDAPGIEVYCGTCREPRMHTDRHGDEKPILPVDACIVCGKRVVMTCTVCGARYQPPQGAYRTPSWLR